jgi:hypothetical protein
VTHEQLAKYVAGFVVRGRHLIPEAAPDPHAVALHIAAGLTKAGPDDLEIIGVSDLPDRLIAGEFDLAIAGALGYA